ncbi:MAG TPA: YdeI/OmpD-associated family protein [Solirubrobacteraceae bacterium]|nr:YdeI/OmpD-associated family protein [Solirubrobacteraceae bacterium]
MTASPIPESHVFQPAGAGDWEAWLEAHEGATEVWLKVGKKGCPVPSITYPEALEVALCFGWIDGQIRGFDEHFTLRRFTPRRPGSKWSQVNREHIERLTAAGRMRPRGLAEVEAAKADGRWDAAYPPASTITVPEDLRAALDANPQASAFFETLTGGDRYAFLYRLHHVTDPARRRKRIVDYVERLADGRTLS